MKTVEMFGVSESAPTKAEAKALLKDIITQAFEGTYTPKLLGFGDCSFLLYRHPQYGWQYSILHATDEQPPIGCDLLRGRGSSGWYESLDAVETAARRHAAQMIYAYGVRDGMEALAESDAVGRSRHADWAQWQDTYHAKKAELLAAGLPEWEAHLRADAYARYEVPGFPIPAHIQEALKTAERNRVPNGVPRGAIPAFHNQRR